MPGGAQWSHKCMRPKDKAQGEQKEGKQNQVENQAQGMQQGKKRGEQSKEDSAPKKTKLPLDDLLSKALKAKAKYYQVTGSCTAFKSSAASDEASRLEQIIDTAGCTIPCCTQALWNSGRSPFLALHRLVSNTPRSKGTIFSQSGSDFYYVAQLANRLRCFM